MQKLTQTPPSVRQVDDNLHPANLKVVNHHRKLLHRFLRQARRLPEDMPRFTVQAATQHVEQFCDSPYYGLERHLKTHSQAVTTVLGNQDSRALEHLTRRIFGYLKLEDAIDIWFRAIAPSPDRRRTGATLVSIDTLMAEWQQVMEKAGPLPCIDRRAFGFHPLCSHLRRAIDVMPQPGDPDFQAGTDALLSELELRSTARDYVAIGQYC